MDDVRKNRNPRKILYQAKFNQEKDTLGALPVSVSYLERMDMDGCWESFGTVRH